MLAKVIAWAPTRAEAARMLADALARARIHGVATNRDLLVRVLRHPAFLAGGTDTGFLDRHPEVFAPLLSSVDAVRLSCLAAALAGAARRARRRRCRACPPAGATSPSALQTVVYEGPTGTIEVGYRLDRSTTWRPGRCAGRPEDIGLPGAALDLAGADHPPAVLGDRRPVVLDVAGVRLRSPCTRSARCPMWTVPRGR